MRLFSLQGATGVQHGDTLYEPGKDGGFDLPDEVAEQLIGSAVGRRPEWENDIQRQDREAADELARRRSPEALFDAVEKLVNAVKGSGGQDDNGGGQSQRRTAARKSTSGKE